MAEPDLAGGPPGIADLQAHACALMGNAARVAFNFERAARHCLWFEASLYKDTRRPTEALLRLAEAERLCRECEDDHWRGKVLMNRAAVLGCQGDFEGALRAHRESVMALDPAREPHLVQIAFHNLAVTYGKLCRWTEARQVLEASEEDFQDCPRLAQGAHRIYRLWTRGRIAHGLGEWEKAEAARLEDVARLAEEVLRALETQPLDPEAFAECLIENLEAEEAIESGVGEEPGLGAKRMAELERLAAELEAGFTAVPPDDDDLR